MKNTAEHLYRRLPSPYGQLCQCCDSREAHHGRHGVPDWTTHTHHVLELKLSYPRQLYQCCPPQTCLLEGLPIHLLISFKSIYLHNNFSQSMSTATKRTAALLLSLVCHESRSCCPFP
ncbi:hypothetical protein SRHO_G00241420 [Serrasalmus rhombeus]